MNKKSLIVIFLAIFLAFAVAILLTSKRESSIQQPEEINQEEIVLEEHKTDIVEENKSEVSEIPSVEKNLQSNIKPAQVVTEQLVEEVSVQEVTIVQEAEPDYGIKKLENGDIEITKEFNSKYPTTYSFKDFGFLYRVK